MVFTCCVPNCNTGYRSNKSEEKVSLFRFPLDKNMRVLWVRAIPRENLIITTSSRVCAKHFNNNDFQTTSSDLCESRRKKRDKQQLKKLRLKATAVPSTFPGLPKYLSKQIPVKRSTISSTLSARLEKTNAKIKENNEKLFIQEELHDFNSFKKKLNGCTMPSGYIKVERNNCVEFHYISNSEDESTAPSLNASIIVRENLSVTAFVSSILLSKSAYNHLMKSENVTNVTEVCNILAFCKNLCTDLHYKRTNHQDSLNLAISILDCCWTITNEMVDFEGNTSLLIKFVTEQLKLLQLQKGVRRYSADLIMLAFLWKLTSNSLYKQLSDVFLLPSVRRLQQISVNLKVETGTLDMSYLKQRTSNLSYGERTVVLLIDEVYTAQRVEYSNGRFIGLTKEGLPAKTVLAFMVQSVCHKYKDVLCLVPIEKLDTKLLNYYFNMVIKAVNDIFFVVAVSVDNHVCNR